MKKIWKFLKTKVWNPLNGKKRDMGIILWLAGKGLEAFFPDLLNLSQTEFLQTIGMILMGVGEAHSLAKKNITKKLLNKIKPKKR